MLEGGCSASMRRGSKEPSGREAPEEMSPEGEAGGH